MLFWESKLIHKLRGKTFVPFLHFVGDEKTDDGKMYHVMVMDLLGKSLEDLFQECRRKFDLKTVLHISVQMVSIPEKLIIQTLIYKLVNAKDRCMLSYEQSDVLRYLER